MIFFWLVLLRWGHFDILCCEREKLFEFLGWLVKEVEEFEDDGGDAQKMRWIRQNFHSRWSKNVRFDISHIN